MQVGAALRAGCRITLEVQGFQESLNLLFVVKQLKIHGSMNSFGVQAPKEAPVLGGRGGFADKALSGFPWVCSFSPSLPCKGTHLRAILSWVLNIHLLPSFLIPFACCN